MKSLAIEEIEKALDSLHVLHFSNNQAENLSTRLRIAPGPFVLFIGGELGTAEQAAGTVFPSCIWFNQYLKSLWEP